MRQPIMFIGSSVKGLTIAGGIETNLEHDCTSHKWTNTFESGYTALENLFNQLNTVDYATFVFKPDDILVLKNEEFLSVRDNVIFELGLFMGRLGRERVFIVKPFNDDKLRLPSDLIGIEILNYKEGVDFKISTSIASNSIRERITKLGKFTNVGFKKVDKTGFRLKSENSPEFLNTKTNQDKDYTHFINEADTDKFTKTLTHSWWDLNKKRIVSLIVLLLIGFAILYKALYEPKNVGDGINDSNLVEQIKKEREDYINNDAATANSNKINNSIDSNSKTNEVEENVENLFPIVFDLNYNPILKSKKYRKFMVKLSENKKMLIVDSKKDVWEYTINKILISDNKNFTVKVFGGNILDKDSYSNLSIDINNSGVAAFKGENDRWFYVKSNVNRNFEKNMAEKGFIFDF